MTDDITQVPGAVVALRYIKLRSELGEDWFDDEFPVTFYRGTRWDPTQNKSVAVTPEYTTWLNCSDTFAWGGSDAEELTAENFPVLEGVISDLMPFYEARLA